MTDGFNHSGSIAAQANRLSRESTLLADLENALEHDIRALSRETAASIKAEATERRTRVAEASKALSYAIVEAFKPSGTRPARGRDARISIPNYNTLSTLIDRISIENVKLAHFEKGSIRDPNLGQKARVQRAMLESLQTELEARIQTMLKDGAYSYMKEERTFA